MLCWKYNFLAIVLICIEVIHIINNVLLCSWDEHEPCIQTEENLE